MPREIKMPKLSDTMEEGTINVWRKGEGDRVEKGDILVEIETDKADMEFEAYMSGTLVQILIPAGDTVAVGTPIAIVRLESDSDDDVATFLGAREAGEARPLAAPRAAAPAEREAPPAARTTPAATAPAAATPFARESLPEPTTRLPHLLSDPDRVRATPRARVLAEERGADLSEIAGSGPDGAVLVSDVERYLEALESSEEPPLEGDVQATPVATRIAEEMNVDLGQVKGTGPGGRVTKRDVRSFLERQSREGPAREAHLYGDEIKLSQKRKFLTRQMVASKATAPHFYVALDVDGEPLRVLRDRLKAKKKRITYTHLILKACAVALERFADVNATYQDDRILRFNLINIALAVDVQGDLVAPVVKDCQGRDLEDLAAATDDLIRKAREKKLAPADYSDGTFTMSNLGMMGIESFYAIITPPMSTVLSVGAVRTVPCVADDGSIGVGRRINFGLACDHRVLDGAKAAQFLSEIRRLVENPEELLGSSAQHGA